MQKKRFNEMNLRILAMTVFGVIIVAFLVAVFFVNNIIGYRNKHIASKGYVSLLDDSANAEPVYLNGEWDYFEGVVCSTEQEVQGLAAASAYMSLPIGGIIQAKINATYRLRFELPKDARHDLVAYIPTFYRSGNVFLNGVKQEYTQDGTPWLESSPIESVVPLTAIDTSKQWQEITISGNFASNDITLHKRPIVIGTMKNISVLAVFSASNEMLLFGLFVLILLNGYVFMIFRPGHKVISLMTLFDSMILFRVAVSMTYVISFGKDVFPFLQTSDRLTSSISVLFLMIGGYVGCKLSEAMYDPDKRAPQWIIAPLPWIYLTFAVIFPLMPHLFETVGKYLLVVVYFITFLGVYLQFRICWEIKDKRVYNSMQMVKTIYIGALIFADILLWNYSGSSLILFYLYGGFFTMHVIVRLYDNNCSYRDVEALNAGLEDTVKQRTMELSQANRVLSELSIKDPLTQIFNRLYFEGAMERAVASFKPEEPLLLCILDLDFFKRINDTYGHATGDEQLKTLVKLVAEQLDEGTVFARIGGEEFVLLYRNMPRQAVLENIENVRAAIQADANENKKHTTASFGVAEFGVDDNAKRLMKRADIALYEAKRLGRNRVATNFDVDNVSAENEEVFA